MATAEGTKKLELLLQCPVCLDPLTDPRAFPCLHFICKPCLKKMPTRGINPVLYECPVCREVSSEGNLRLPHFLSELFEITKLGKQNMSQCHCCKNNVALHRCLDCKEIFCGTCRKHHDSFSMMKHHEWRDIDRNDIAVVDKHIYCNKHKGEIIKLYCKSCKMLICVLCRGTEHHLHEAETIEAALESKVSEVKLQIDECEKWLSEHAHIALSLGTKTKGIEEDYDAICGEIDAYYNEIMEKVLAAREDTKVKLAAKRKKQISEIKRASDELKMRMNAQKNALAVTRATLSTARGSFLLQSLQSGLTISVEVDDTWKARATKLSDQAVVQFVLPRLKMSQNFTGEIIDHPYSMFIGLDLTKLGTPTLKQNLATKLDFECRRFAVIKNKIWCVEYSTDRLQILNTDGTKHNTFNVSGIGSIKGFAEGRNCVLLATNKGLYSINYQGTKLKLEFIGDIGDVSVLQKSVYILDIGKECVHIVQIPKIDNAYQVIGEFKVRDLNADYCNRIQVCSQYVYLGIGATDYIHQYTHSGVLVAEHMIDNSLNYSHMCGADVNDNLLVGLTNVYDVNMSFNVLHPDGRWKELINTLPGINGLLAISSNTLIYIDTDKNTLYNFSIDPQ